MGGQSSSQFEEDDWLKQNEYALIEILVRVPARDIVKSCVLVSHHLRDVTASPSLWRKKCEQEGKYLAGVMPVPEDFKKLYFSHPYTRNFIKNPCATDGLKYWEILRNGGDGFKVESDCDGSQNIDETDMRKEWPKGKINNWVTSYTSYRPYWPCEKRQVIDLVKEGVAAPFLDEIRMPIYVSEWYAARRDCASHYELEIKLLTEEREVVDVFFWRDDIPQSSDAKWKKVEHVFKNYKSGVRLIEFRHLGNDRQSWAGHYGSKFTLSTVKFMFTQCH